MATDLREFLRIGAGVAIATGAYMALVPGGTPVTAVQDVMGLLTGNIPLTDAQRAMLRAIAAELDSAGLAAWGVAFGTNAYAESRLNPRAAALPPEDSVGLFQLNAKGAGRGMTVEQRQDPGQNIRRIIEEARGRGIEGQHPATEGDAVVWFAREVERCSACGHSGGDGELVRRRALADSLFGAGVSGASFGTSGRIA